MIQVRIEMQHQPKDPPIGWPPPELPDFIRKIDPPNQWPDPPPPTNPIPPAPQPGPERD